MESESTDLGEPEIEKIMEQKYDDIIDKVINGCGSGRGTNRGCIIVLSLGTSREREFLWQ